MKVSRFSIICSDFELLLTKLWESLKDNYLGESTELYQINEEAYALYYESYSMRIESNLMVSVIIQKLDDDKVNFKIFSGGGKQSVFGIGWGAEKSRIHLFLDFIMKQAKEYKWKLTDLDEDSLKYVEKNMKYNE